MGQTTKDKESPSKEETSAPAPKDLTEKKEGLKEDMDALLDEIDEVLEENAEQFVRDYVQRGGE